MPECSLVGKIFIGLGGSATNDAGAGIAAALGYQFLDINGNLILPKGGILDKVARIIKPSHILSNVSFYAINDVSNPLFGKIGAAKVYGKQKGASASEIAILDAGLKILVLLLRRI